jgi:hypothetical protein
MILLFYLNDNSSKFFGYLKVQVPKVQKGAMMNEGYFLPLKTRKALENQGLLC